MTNEEALHCIKTTDYCYVVWSIEKNVVIAVYPVPRDATIEQRSAALSMVDSEHAGPTKGRFLDPRTTTLTTLSEEQQQTETIHGRERTFRAWQAYSTNDLLGILERGEFPPPMDPFYGAQHIIDQLYFSPRRALSSEQLGRLDAMAASSCASLSRLWRCDWNAGSRCSIGSGSLRAFLVALDRHRQVGSFGRI